MRTTIELPDHQRAKLLELAARRGLKGFSRLVQEAVEQYLAQLSPPEDKTRAALAVLGTLSEREGDALEHSVAELREQWR